jgi:hypothetical protein
MANLFAPRIQKGRGTLILILGLLSLLFGPFLGIPAWVIAKNDLVSISIKLLPESERDTTKVGMTLGIIGTFFGIGAIVVYGIIAAIVLSIMQA